MPTAPTFILKSNDKLSRINIDQDTNIGSCQN